MAKIPLSEDDLDKVASGEAQSLIYGLESVKAQLARFLRSIDVLIVVLKSDERARKRKRAFDLTKADKDG